MKSYGYMCSHAIKNKSFCFDLFSILWAMRSKRHRKKNHQIGQILHGIRKIEKILAARRSRSIGAAILKGAWVKSTILKWSILVVRDFFWRVSPSDKHHFPPPNYRLRPVIMTHSPLLAAWQRLCEYCYLYVTRSTLTLLPLLSWNASSQTLLANSRLYLSSNGRHPIFFHAR